MSAPVVRHRPHLPGVLLDQLDRSDRVGLGCREQLLEPATSAASGPRNGFVARTIAKTS